MKTFHIIDCNNSEIVLTLQAGNGKAALKRFRENFCFNSGMYEIHKNAKANSWILSSSYGAFFAAYPVKE